MIFIPYLLKTKIYLEVDNFMDSYTEFYDIFFFWSYMLV